MEAISSAIVKSVTPLTTDRLTEETIERMISDQARQDDLLQKIDSYLEQHEPLMDAYQKLESIILKLFGAERMSIFQRRRLLHSFYKRSPQTLVV